MTTFLDSFVSVAVLKLWKPVIRIGMTTYVVPVYPIDFIRVVEAYGLTKKIGYICELKNEAICLL